MPQYYETIMAGRVEISTLNICNFVEEIATRIHSIRPSSLLDCQAIVLHIHDPPLRTGTNAILQSTCLPVVLNVFATVAQ